MTKSIDVQDEGMRITFLLSKSSAIIAKELVSDWRTPAPDRDGYVIEMTSFSAALIHMSLVLLDPENKNKFQAAMEVALGNITESWFSMADGKFRSGMSDRVKDFEAIMGTKSSLTSYAEEANQRFLKSIRIPNRLNSSSFETKRYLYERYSEYLVDALSMATNEIAATVFQERLETKLIKGIYTSSSMSLRTVNGRSLTDAYLSEIGPLL